jgi:hypothetical protein
MVQTNITQTRICVQKMPHTERHEYNKIMQSSSSDKHAEKLKAAFQTKKIWPRDSKIRIAFTESGDNVLRPSVSGKNIDPLQNEVQNMSVQEAIKKIVKERIIPLVNLDIDFIDKPADANVRISFDESGGAWSLVGTDHLSEKTNPTMNFGWFDVPTVIHEMGHMLGMIHEHQNPKGQNIDWNDKKVFEWAKETQRWDEQTTTQNILDKYDSNSINGSSFDPQSIMLYFFEADLTNNGVGTKQTVRLSGIDVDWIHQMYPKDNGITPTAFYKEVYNSSLQSSIDTSERMAKIFSETGQIGQLGQLGQLLYNLKPIIENKYFILFIIGIFLLVGLLWLLKR